MARIYEQLRDYINWAVGLTFTVAFFLLSKDKIIELFRVDPILASLSTVLLIVTAAAFLLYAKAVRHELDLLDSAFDPHGVKFLTGSIASTVALLSIFFGVLLAFTTDILVYSTIVVLASIFDLHGQATAITNIGRLLLRRQFRGAAGEQEAEILFQYYFERPLLLRISIVLFAYVGAFVLALLSRLEEQPRYGIASYVVIITAIIAGETVIHSWRQKRDRALAVIPVQVAEESA